MGNCRSAAFVPTPVPASGCALPACWTGNWEGGGGVDIACGCTLSFAKPQTIEEEEEEKEKKEEKKEVLRFLFIVAVTCGPPLSHFSRGCHAGHTSIRA